MNKNNERMHVLKVKKKCADVLLSAFADVAEKNANAMCRGFMFEPNVPKKLNKRREKKS